MRTSALLAAVFFVASLATANAAPVFDANQGSWSDQYFDSAGIAPASSGLTADVVHEASARQVRLVSGFASGQLGTTVIAPTSFSAWGGVYTQASIPAGAALDLFVLDQATGTLYGDAGATGTLAAPPVPLSAGPSDRTGFSARYDVSAIPVSVDNAQIIVKFTAVTINVGDPDEAILSPALDALAISWTPRSVVDLRLSAPASVGAGSTIAYRLNAAISFVNATDLVVTLPLPTATANPENQNQSVTFVSANAGGTLNAAGDAIVWDLGQRSAGDTFVLLANVRTRIGLLDGTIYQTTAAVTASNADGAVAGPVSAAIVSNPNPWLNNRSFGNTYLLENQERAFSGSTITVRASGGNWRIVASSGAETLFDSVVYDDVSSLIDTPGALGPNGVHNISHLGMYTDVAIDLANGRTIPAKSVYWMPGDLTPGQGFNFSYDVQFGEETGDGGTLAGDEVFSFCDYVGGATVPQTADWRGPVCKTVKLGVPVDPNGTIALGEAIRGFRRVSSAQDLVGNPRVEAGFGDTVSYPMYIVNQGISALDDIIMFNEVPPEVGFVSAFLPASAAGSIHYYTGPISPGVPPDFTDTDGTLGTLWLDAAPVDPSTVTWVAFRVAKLSSRFDAAPTAPVSVTAEIDVVIPPPVGDCPDRATIDDYMYAFIYGFTPPNDSTPTVISPPWTGTNHEETVVVADKPNLSASSVGANTSVVTGGDTLTYTVRLQNRNVGNVNTPLDTALNSSVEINLPAVAIDGVPGYLPVVSVTAPGGSISYNLPTGVTVTYPAPVPVNDSRTISLSVQIPPGIVDGTGFSLSAAFTADDDICGSVAASAARSVSYAGVPALSVGKSIDLAYGQVGTVVTYSLDYSNTSVSPSTRSWVVDAIAPQLELQLAQVPPGGAVWFSNAGPPTLPATLDALDSFDETRVLANFTQAVDADGDGWVETPFGAATSYVAFLVDNAALTPAQLPSMRGASVSFTAVVSSGEIGSVVTNEAAIFSSELIQAIGNKSLFTITGQPGLRTLADCPAIVSATESYDFVVDYYNDSANNDASAMVTLTVPDGVTVGGATHTYNDAYLTANPTPPVITPTVDGQVVTVSVGALAPLEGGSVTLSLTPDPATESGTFLVPNALGVAVGDDGDTQSSYTECSTSVENADLFLRILVDNPTPRAGQVFNATLLVSNEGAHDALESLIDSVLPEGLSLVPGTAIITPFPWTMTSSAQPSQVGDTLLWTAGTDNGITYDDREPGTMPGLSGVASIVFSLVVDDGSAGGTDLVLPGTTLEICGAISTETGEDGNFPNHGCETVTTPLPDPWVGLSAPAVRRPNDRATFTLSYGNNNNEIAGGVVAIFTVPDGPAPDADGTPDLVYTGHQATNGETTWFHSVGGPAPAFDPADPAAGGWSQTPDLTIGVAHVAFFAGDLAPYAGPYSVTIDLLMQGLGDPPAPVFPGSQFDGTATVVMTTSGFGDANVDNNSATATTRVPGIDLALDKDATPRGAFPGVLPGDLVVWTMTVTNSGTVDAHGVRVSDALPPELELVSPPAELIVESSAGVASQPVDALGNPYITPVSWVADGAGNYYMGDNSAGVNPGDYRRLGLAPGDSAVLQLTTRVRDAVPDSTVVLNTATVVTDYVLGWMDGDPVESPELLGNNTDSVSVTVYLPNVCITVSVVDSTNGSTAQADVGDTLTYTLEYSNPGNFEAENVIIEDAIPDGADFIVGSLSGLDPDAVTVHYSDDGGATFDYVPAGITGSRDGDVTHIQVRWNEPLTAPAGAIFVQDTAADFAEGTHVNTTPLPALGGLAGTGGNICDDVECQDVACETGLTYVPDGECCPVCAPTVPGCADGTPHAAAECSELAFNGSWTGCLPAADSCNIECFGGWTDIPDASDASDVCRDTYAWAAGAIEECAAANPEDLTACEYIKCGPTAEPGSACPDAEPLWDTCWRAEAGACPDVQAYQCANWQYVDACGWTYQGGLNSYIGCIQAVPAGSESFCDWLKPSDDCSPCATQICNNTDPELLTSSSTAWWLSDYLVDPLVKLGVVLGERGLSVPADLMPGNPYQACSGPRSCSVEGSGSACVVPCGQFQDCQICDKQGLVCAVCPGGDFIGDIQLGVSIDQGGATIGSCESNAAYIKGLWDECEEERLVFGGADDFCDFTKPPECSRAECERQCFTSPVFPAEGEGTILEWNFAAINDAVDESSSIAYSVLDPATGLPIDGLADLPSPGDGAIDLSGLSPDDHQQLQLSACFNGTPSPTNCVDIISPPKACPEYYYSGYPYHIHDNGTVVGGYGRFDPECRFESQPPFVWTEATGFHYIDAPDGEEEVTWGYAQMSNAAGAVVGVTGVYDGEVQRDLMFYWTPEGGTQEIPAPEQVSSAYQCHFATESLVACSFRGESGYQLLAWNVGSDTSYAVGAAQRSGDRVDVDSAGRLYFATDFGSAFLDGDGMTVVQTGAARWDPMLGREELDISGAACQGTSNWIANVDEDDTYYGACRGPQRWGFTWTENGGASRIAVEGLNREADLYDANDAGVSVGRVVNGISQITALYRLKDGTILDVPTPDGFTGMEFWSVGENGDASVWLLGGDGTSTGIYHPSTGLTLLTPTRDGEYWDIGWPNAANAAGELMIYGYSDNDNTDLILRYAPCTAGSAPYVADWRVIYRTDKNPSFDFQVAVDDVCQTQLTDTATISTTSPETATDNNTDTATIAVNTADVSVTITSDPVVVQTGDTVTWTVTWENLGPGVASDVEVVVNLPAGTNVKGRIALPPVSTLGPGESGSETFSGQVISDEANLAMVATADIATPTIDCVVDNDTSSTTTTIGSYPNVYVTIEGPPTVTVGELATYTLTYGNNGNDTAEAVEVSYSVPSGLTVSSTPAGASIEGDVVTWVIGAVEPGTTAVVTVMVATNACDNAGDTVVHRADIATASFELDTSDNGDSTDAIVLGPAGELAVAIDDNRDTVALGEAVTVVVHYQSTGAAAVGGATLDLTLNGLNVVVGSPSADGAITAGGASWNLGDLAPGDNGSVLLQVAGDAQVGSLDAVLTGAGACDALASASGPETQAPGLFVTKSSDSATACAGGAPHVWSITVVNTSDSSIDGVVVTDPVPAGWTYVSGSIAGIGGSDDDPQTLRWDVGTLAAGTALTFTYMALPSDGGVLSGIVTGSTASVTAGESASTATALVPLICRPLVSLEKGWAPGCALTDGALTFTLNYKNNGNRPQTIEISDKLPAGTTFSGASVGTFDIVRQRFLATIIDVPPGGAGKITLEVQVDSGTAPGTLLTNRASFSAVDGQEVVTNGTSGQVAGGVLSCGDGNACTIDTCSPTMGCIYPNELQGTICNDGDACTQVDSCDEGACVGAQPVLCTALDQCHQAGMCDSATGVCSNPNVDDETTCDDQDACTSDDLCVAGTCVSGDVVDCDDDDQCTADSCDTQLGCMNAPQTDTPCEDGDLCSLDDFCVVGVCVSGDDKDCVASDQCHGVGVCNPESGECSDPVVPAETACDDGDPCTIDDVCAEGTCGGGAEVTCEAPNACFTAGSCTSGTGACEPVAVAGDVPYAPRLNDVGTLGGADSQALAVNDAGVVVGAAQTQDGSWHAFRYDGEGGMVDLTPNAGETGRAFAAHGVDLVFGVVDAAAGISVFVHDGTALTMLWATDSVDSAAASVFGPTSDGAVAGVGASGAQPTSSWYWTPGESTPTQISSDMGAAIATGIGEAGHVSGYVVTGDGTRRAFVWTSGGGMQLLAGLGGADSSAEAWDVDVDGVVVGASRNADDALRATHWSAAGTATDLGVLCSGADCAASSRATHINDGEIAGVSGDKLFYAASASTALVEVGTLGGASTVVAVDSGTVVCNTTTAWGTERAAVWTAATGLAELGTAGGDMARATSYNNGWVAGVTAAGGDVQRAFLWSAERRFEVLGTLGGASSAGAAVNASGLVVGWSDVGDEGGASHAFISDVPALACVACETDPDPPVLVCPIASGSVECVAGGAAIALGAPTAYDLCGLPVSVDDDAPDLFDVGVTPVTFSASDAEGNQATCVMQVAVEDTLPPTVTCPEAMEVASAVDVCGTAVELTATATDGCDEVVATIISNAPEIFPLGETTVTMTAVDAAGNQGSCETVITVVDETPLTLFCPEDYTVELPGDACETDEELTATVDDQCLVQVDVVVESETLGVGEHRVDFEANDNTGEAAACATIVTVVDVTPPTVDCGDVETLDRDALPIVVTSSASDACSATMSIEDVDCGLAADCQVQIDGGQLTVLALGYDLAEVTWTVVATDPSGNITREVCSFPFEPGIRDRDGDTIADDLDNCPDTPNTLQLDFDGDRIGNLCDLVDEGLVASGSGGCQSSSGAGSTLWLLLGVFGFAMLRRRRKERGYSVR